MKILRALLLAFFILSIPSYSLALFTPNNKVGIHLAVPNDDDIQRASDLTNATGGKWGYVTLVIQENDRSRDKWQQVFDKLREKKLIPIIRLATSPQGPVWKKPKGEDVKEWVSFLSSLNWVVKNRYVILFNEPNHGQEWGGAINPKEYTEVADIFSRELKKNNQDYFVMLAGLDAAAPSAAPAYQDEAVYLQGIVNEKPDIFKNIDGLSSHSYPNPGFAGGPAERGRNTVNNYDWELGYLKSLGVQKDLPVFITETGWSTTTKSPETVSDYLVSAYQNLWLPDDRVRAVTPFVLNYQAEPFLQFSWQKKDSTEMQPFYASVQALIKQEGQPEQIQKGKISLDLPKELFISSTYAFPIRLENKGQALWDNNDGYELRVSEGSLPNAFFSNIESIKPFSSGEVKLFLKTGVEKATNTVQIALYKGLTKIMDAGVWTYITGPLPKLTFEAPLLLKIRREKERVYEFQLFDAQEQLVFKKKDITIKNGEGVIEQIRNVYVAGKYRAVVLTEYYLPRQTYLRIHKDFNEVSFKPLIPGDFNKDGKFGLDDIGTAFKNPGLLLQFVP